jgi:hypothetical protein
VFLRAFARSRKVKGNADGRLVCRPTAIRYYVNKRRLWSILLPYHFSLSLSLFLSYIHSLLFRLPFSSDALLCSLSLSPICAARAGSWLRSNNTTTRPFRYFSMDKKNCVEDTQTGLYNDRASPHVFSFLSLFCPAIFYTLRAFVSICPSCSMNLTDSTTFAKLWNVTTTTTTTTPTSGKGRKNDRECLSHVLSIPFWITTIEKKRKEGSG